MESYKIKMEKADGRKIRGYSNRLRPNNRSDEDHGRG
jgi:hypothetical protein